jgi:epoxyqueuosine reductase
LIDIPSLTFYHTSVMTLKEEIRAQALILAFSACGFANADYDPVFHSRFTHWIGDGHQADMNYMERGSRQRFDPRIHLSKAKSVIVCSMNYYSEPSYDPSKPYISLYARGENYHRVMKDKLDSLSQTIREKAGNVTLKSFVDSSPMAEKSWAAKAGLGFIGKNDLLIVFDNKNGKKRKSLGSFHFLGVIISDLELEPDHIQPETCGKCRKCIEACPTGAICDDRLIDANKCIAFHTLENENNIPIEIARSMGNNIFGCDICQLVCPYNNNLLTTTEPRFAPDPQLVNIDLDWLANMADGEFKKRFRKSTIGERSLSLLRRNVSIAIENIRLL